MTTPPFDPNTLSYHTPTGPSKPRRMAFRILLILGILMILGGFCISGSVIFSAVNMTRHAAAPSPLLLYAIAAAYFIGLTAWGAGYIWTGVNIKSGGHASAIVALVLSGLHTLLLLLSLVSTLIALVTVFARLHGGAGPALIGTLIPVFIILLFLAALGQLIYFLIQCLREPR